MAVCLDEQVFFNFLFGFSGLRGLTGQTREVVSPLSSAGKSWGWSDGHACLSDRAPDSGDRASSLFQIIGRANRQVGERKGVCGFDTLCLYSGRLVKYFFLTSNRKACYIADMGYGFKIFF